LTQKGRQQHQSGEQEPGKRQCKRRYLDKGYLGDHKGGTPYHCRGNQGRGCKCRTASHGPPLETLVTSQKLYRQLGFPTVSHSFYSY